ncbi:polyketide synthase [Apiospora marii]|uniref:Polyketide synthase n=1 Tax=Apiospora marii TaxID=335849 RepID=A0ABR1T0Y5_9PEZI
MGGEPSGPHGALAGHLRQVLTAESSAPYIPALSRNKNSMESLISTLGKLYCLHAPINLKAILPLGQCLSGVSLEPQHELLGRIAAFPRVAPPSASPPRPLGQQGGREYGSRARLSELAPSPQRTLDPRPKVGQDIVFPFAGYIALAGEAVRRLYGERPDGFKIRNILVSVASVLSEDKPTEMVTALRPRPWTNTLSSHWWEFTVASHNGHTSNKHCTGEATAPDPPPRLGQPTKPEVSSLPRRIGPEAWCGTLCRGGLDLDPGFQTIRGITTSTNADHKAVGRIANGGIPEEGTLQLLSVAAVNGYSRKVKNWLPTSIDEISVSRCHQDMTSLVSASVTSKSSLLGRGRCVADDESLVLEATGIKMALADGSQLAEGAGATNAHATARVARSPDIEFLHFGDLLQPKPDRLAQTGIMYELADLCLLAWQSHLGKAGRAVANADHVQKWARWMSAQAQRQGLPCEGEAAPPSLPRMPTWLVVSDTHLWHPPLLLYPSFVKVCPGSGVSGHRTVSCRDARQPRPLRGGVRRPVPVPASAWTLGTQLAHLGDWRRGPTVFFPRRLGASDPARGGVVLCSKYTFTSTGFISAKGQQQTGFACMEYATLDIGKDVSEQGFEEDHLANVRRLLSPDGRLLLRELCPTSKWVMIYGSNTAGGEVQVRRAVHQPPAIGIRAVRGWPRAGG